MRYTHMYKWVQFILITWLFLGFSHFAMAAMTGTQLAPQPNLNIKTTVTAENSQWWSTGAITLTNTSNAPIEMRDSTIIFQAPSNISNIYGDFTPLSWPGKTSIQAIPQDNQYQITYILGFDEGSWVNTTLASGASITLKFGSSNPIDTTQMQKSVKVYTNSGAPAATGSILFIAPAAPGADAGSDASATVKCADQALKNVVVAWDKQFLLSSLPFGTCTIHINQAGPYPGGADQQITLSENKLSATINLSYLPKAKTATFTVQMPAAPASNAPTQQLFLQDVTRGTAPEAITTSWGAATKQENLTDGNTYQVWFNNFQYNGINYKPFYTEQKPMKWIADSKKPKTISMSYFAQIIPTIPATMTMTGVPAQATVNVILTGTGNNNSYSLALHGGSNQIKVIAGQYNIAAEKYKVNDKTYTASVNNPYAINKNSIITIAYSEASISGNTIPGWPTYLAMGTVTDNDETVVTKRLVKNPVDAIFKYAGNDGGGDRGQVLTATTTENTIKQSRNVEAATGKKVIPVMVVYTVEASGSIWGAEQDLLNNTNLMMHYATLILEANKIQTYKDANHAYPGSIILNPDFLGMLQQTPSNSLMTATIDVNRQLQAAIAYVKEHYGIAAPASVPTFSNNLKGFIQSTNYVVRTFGPDVTFGWQQNLWAEGSALWIHQRYTDAEIAAGNVVNGDNRDNNFIGTDKIVDFMNQLGVYQGPYKPDFIVVDKWERDDLGGDARGAGYAFNAQDWQNYLRYVKNISRGLGVPAIIWQIPGGHMPIQSEVYDPNWIAVHAGDAPDFFFGDVNIGTDINKVNATLLNYPLNPGFYNGAMTVKQYLLQPGSYDWAQSNLQNAVDSNVVAILWGGGSTTGVVPISTNGDDKGWLAAKVAEYYKNPLMLQE